MFQYIRLLRKEGPKEWIFEEIKKLGEMELRFKGMCTALKKDLSCLGTIRVSLLPSTVVKKYPDDQ